MLKADGSGCRKLTPHTARQLGAGNNGAFSFFMCTLFRLVGSFLFFVFQPVLFFYVFRDKKKNLAGVGRECCRSRSLSKNEEVEFITGLLIGNLTIF